MSTVDRAAKAIWETWPERFLQPWEARREEMKDETRKEARNALLAAFDTTDDELFEGIQSAVAFALQEDVDDEALAVTRAVFATIKSIVSSQDVAE